MIYEGESEQDCVDVLEEILKTQVSDIDTYVENLGFEDGISKADDSVTISMTHDNIVRTYIHVQVHRSGKYKFHSVMDVGLDVSKHVNGTSTIKTLIEKFCDILCDNTEEYTRVMEGHLTQYMEQIHYSVEYYDGELVNNFVSDNWNPPK